MRSYSLVATVTATGAALANLQLIQGGRIKSVRWCVRFDGPADNAAVDVECSTQGAATSQITTNDSPDNTIDQVSACTNLTTSGAFQGGINEQRFVDKPIAAGQRIYLNAVVNGTVSAQVRCIVDVA